ncbi:hypothetical protein FEZ48_02245 [Marinilactibacillus psychrotolerans]|uniref:Gamma-glutamyltransferase n=1 Tax=Marinilactibacillus psychrotolerans TaxID=191770 RepID=A0A5R9C746_9LACT|nr:hypothetical protein FEZ48_02245 [Marinilactibacillus psychrotolerans]
MKNLILGVTTLSLLLSGCASEEPADESLPSEDETISMPEEEDDGENDEATEEELDTLNAYGVSAGHPIVVDVGMDILENGGNAVDAAIAIAFAVSVVEPFTSVVGGGGVTLVHEQGQDPESYDYREVVPENGIP